MPSLKLISQFCVRASEMLSLYSRTGHEFHLCRLRFAFLKAFIMDPNLKDLHVEGEFVETLGLQGIPCATCT